MKAKEVEDFDEILSQAEMNASTGFECDFVNDIREKYDNYESEMFISEKQISTLEKIANW